MNIMRDPHNPVLELLAFVPEEDFGLHFVSADTSAGKRGKCELRARDVHPRRGLPSRRKRFSVVDGVPPVDVRQTPHKTKGPC